ncbi:hypothetical protein [Nostoc sp. DSM 114159]|jgi:hypothetical protein
MNTTFVEIVNACKKPNTELLKQVLTERSSLSDAESDFLTYMAGFTHYEFTKNLFQQFGLFFIEGTSILFDSINKNFHVKILINDQTLDFESFSLEAIAQAEQATIIENRIQFRDRNGMYIDGLSKLLRSMTVARMQDYLSKSNMGIYEDVVLFRRILLDNSFVLHFVRVGQRNILINLETIFVRVTASIFVNFSDKKPNLSLFNIQNKNEIYALLKNIYWYVLDIERPEEIIDLLKKIQADFTLVPYVSDEYNYFQGILLDIESRILSAIALR